MTLAGKLLAAAMTLVLALFPVALERCRTACIAMAASTPGGEARTHACHEAPSNEENGARVSPVARSCGHGDEARTYESRGTPVSNSRASDLMPGSAPGPVLFPVRVLSASLSSSSASALGPPFLSFALPLRL